MLKDEIEPTIFATMKGTFILLLFTILSYSGWGQKLEAYRVFGSNGKKSSFEKMLKAAHASEVVLFGELHNNPISHWFQLELTTSMLKSNKLVLGAEMIEADNQDELNQYLDGSIDEKSLDSVARLWPNHTTDYQPLVDLAKNEKLPFIATNVPRRFAKLVYRAGFESLDTLSAEEKAWIVPLPPAYDSDLPGYKAMLEMMGGHGGENFPKAQAIKDATMAHFIIKNMLPNHTFIHYHGTYHSNNYEGIMWYLQQKNPRMKITTIATVSQADVSKLDAENKQIADFIICVDENMTTTH
jgi:uncharacterized iron-regulated protein